MDIDVSAMEILDELSRTAPLELERASLRVANRKLASRVIELEQGESPSEQTSNRQEPEPYNPGAGYT